jgi:hypothetical protein
MESINRSKTTVGILTKEGKWRIANSVIGVILGAERSEMSKLLDESKYLQSSRIYLVRSRKWENV